LLDEALAIAGTRNKIWLTFRRYDNGEEIITIPAKEQGKIKGVSVARSEFLELLYQAVLERGAAELHTNKGSQVLEDRGNEMLITFKDGTTATADLVIGCDGIHSNVRSHYVQDNARWSGKVVYRGLCPIDKLKDWWPLETYGATWLAKHKHILVFPISNNDTMNIVAFVSATREEVGDTKESWTLPGDKAAVQEAFQDCDSTVRRMIDLMDGKPAKWLLHDRQPLKEWIFAGGKVALLGDAAHAMLPHQGAGAGQAIEDGYILGRTLQDFFQQATSSKSRSLEDWLHASYQSVRLPRAEGVQKTSREAGEIYEMETAELDKLDYDECVPLVREHLKDRMRWIWTEDIDVVYENARI